MATQQSSNDDEAELMQRVSVGDEAAFHRLAERHVGRLLRFAQHFLGDAVEADDVAQEALLRLWLHAERWRPSQSRLSTWLYSIAYRLCVDRARSQTRLSSEPVKESVDPTPGALDALSRRDELLQLEGAMQSLQARQRHALTLFYLEELSGEESAAILGVTVGAFWSLLHRARTAIHLELRGTKP